jgi:hypothetical protein
MQAGLIQLHDLTEHDFKFTYKGIDVQQVPLSGILAEQKLIELNPVLSDMRFIVIHATVDDVLDCNCSCKSKGDLAHGTEVLENGIIIEDPIQEGYQRADYRSRFIMYLYDQPGRSLYDFLSESGFAITDSGMTLRCWQSHHSLSFIIECIMVIIDCARRWQEEETEG